MSFMFRFNSIFFVEDAGELCIIILEEKGQSPKLHIYILTPHKKTALKLDQLPSLKQYPSAYLTHT
jgi:hypothetical protein